MLCIRWAETSLLCQASSVPILVLRKTESGCRKIVPIEDCQEYKRVGFVGFTCMCKVSCWIDCLLFDGTSFRLDSGVGSFLDFILLGVAACCVLDRGVVDYGQSFVDH